MYIKSPFPPVPPLAPTNFHTWLFENPGNAVPDDHILHIDALTGEERTYGQFIERVKDAATALAAPRAQGGLGVQIRENEIVGIMAPNSMDYIVLVHACLRLAVPFACLPAHPTLLELEYLLKKAQFTRLFVHPSLFELLSQGVQKVRLSQDIIYLLDGNVGDRPDLDNLINGVHRNAIPRHPVVPVSKDTLAFLIFSSGTSGTPKAVMVSHDNCCFSMAQVGVMGKEYLKVTPPPDPSAISKWLCVLPLYHSYGLHYFMFRVYIDLKTIVILPRWNLPNALAAISKYKITHLALVPSIIAQLVNSPQTKNKSQPGSGVDLSSVKFVGSGAAYLPPKLARQLSELLKLPIEPVEGYGLSEATIGTLTRPPPGLLGYLQPVPNSTGILLPGQEARIVREDGSDADVGEPGEFLLKGGNVTLGYWNDPDATRETFLEGGWLRTGDRFRVDKNGTFFYEDRLKDTLKVSGAQVSPLEIENVLLAHPAKLVDDTAVAGVAGNRAGIEAERVPRAWVVLSPAGKAMGEAAAKAELMGWVERSLSRYKWLAGGMEFVESIPKSPTGKVLRRKLQEAYAKEREHERVKSKL